MLISMVNYYSNLRKLLQIMWGLLKSKCFNVRIFHKHISILKNKDEYFSLIRIIFFITEQKYNIMP